MKINKKHGFLLLMLSIIIILAIGITSATEITNETTQVIKNDEPVSTTDTVTSTNNEKSIKLKENNQTTKMDSPIYASSDADSNNNGTTKNQPTTLTNAISRAQNGQTIILSTYKTTDTYKITSPIYIYKSLTIMGETGKTIILDGQGKSNIFNINGATITLNNIKILNSKTTTAPISSTNSDLTITDSTIKNNEGKLSGAILSKDSNLKIINTTFTNNTSENQGGAITQIGTNTLNISESTFTKNNAQYDGGSIYSVSSNVQITTTKFENNKARNGGALYLGNNVNDIQLKIIKSEFTNNKATNNGDSIWTNYNITINDNAFISTNNNNWVYLDANCKNNLKNNWWSTNTPNFNVITNGIIPANWRLVKVTNQTSSNTKQLIVSINTLSDSTITTNILPARQVTYTADTGNFTKTTQQITKTVTNTYTGNSNNIKVKIDNQQVTINTKTETILSINNITTEKSSTIKFNIQANPDITSQVTLKINNVTLTPAITNGNLKYTYTIPSTWKANNYTTTLTFPGNNIYAPKTINGYLLVKETGILIVPLTNKDITLTTTTLPAAYDLRNLSLVTPVKSQGGSGSCWAFSSIGSLESTLLKKTGITYDLSENNMKNVLKKYSIIGNSESNPNTGFNDLEPIAYLVGWYGPVNESFDTYSPSSYLSPLLNSDIHIQDVYIIPNRQTFTDNYLIKQAIYLFGGVSTGIYKPTTTNSYTTGKSIDHSVVIVGWDDNYSKTNFSPNPPGDGAFIIKNSWGNSTGKNGYHYVSYYDESIGSYGITSLLTEQYNYVFLHENKDNYTGIYQYDITVNTLDESSLTDYIAFKNIYTATKDENIAAIGSYFLQASNYTIELYTNNKLVYTQTGKITLPGYRTIRLNKYIPIQKDEQFTAVIKISGTNEVPVLVEYSDLYYSSIHDSTSFLSFDGTEWLDLYEYECTAPLKVYTKDTPLVTSTATEDNRVITVTTKINNIQSKGYLTYYINNEIVKVNGKVLNTTITKDQTITKTFNDTSKISLYNLTVVYTSENYAIKQNITLKNELKEPTLTVFTNKSVTIGENITVTGTLSSDKELSNANIVVTIGSDNYTVKTDINGYYEVSCLVNSTEINLITVIFNGNQRYSAVSNTTMINVIKRNSKLTLDTIKQVVYGDNVTITGKLTDTDGTVIVNEGIKVSINGKAVTTRTNSKGIFSVISKVGIVGINNVSATYNGDSYYNDVTVNTTFKRIKQDLILTIDTIKQVVYGNNVVITGRFTDGDGNARANTNVKVQINGKSGSAVTDKNGYYKFSSIIGKVGVNNVTVSHSGSANYNPTSINSKYVVIKADLKISLDTIKQVVYGNDVVITGRFTDGDGNARANTNLKVQINGKSGSAKTDSKGYFKFTSIIGKVGVNNVTVSHSGGTNFNPTSTSSKFTMVKQDLKITINTIKQVTYGDKIIITGKFTDANGEVRANSNIKILVNGKSATARTDSKGVFTFTTKIGSVGINNVTVSHNGGSNFNPTSTSTTFKMVKQDLKITINSIGQVKKGGVVTISGKFTDANNVLRANSNLKVLINSKEYTATTDSKGVYTFKTIASLVGTNNVTVSHSGGANYNPTSCNSSFVVIN